MVAFGWIIVSILLIFVFVSFRGSHLVSALVLSLAALVFDIILLLSAGGNEEGDSGFEKILQEGRIVAVAIVVLVLIVGVSNSRKERSAVEPAKKKKAMTDEEAAYLKKFRVKKNLANRRR